jgi:hypothetical protein
LFSQPTQTIPKGERKYSEEDILMLIKFIVKEFAKIIQRWSISQSNPLSMLGLVQPQQPNLNQLLLNMLLNRENLIKQQQETLANSLLQQMNPRTLIEMLDQRQPSGVSTPKTMSANTFAPMAPNSSQAQCEQKEEADDIKMPEREPNETKDEVDTIQSSEDKTHRKRSVSEDTCTQSKRISLEQAYSILNGNSLLSNLLRNNGHSQ